MRNWHKYWNTAKLIFAEDVLCQVGKTVNGEPISADHLAHIVRDIRLRLKLDSGDRVLDLCCGNGIITHQVAGLCEHVTAVDFSLPLLEVARRKFNAKNIEYIIADVCELPCIVFEKTITKIYMYEALQHLSLEQTATLFARIAELPENKPLIYFGAVPDKERIWEFYNTFERREIYRISSTKGTELIGHWWSKEELVELAGKFGFNVQINYQSASLHGAHYRFDALCSPSERNVV